MFARHRKARVLFGLSDIIVAALAFEAAYQTRAVLHLEHDFFLTVERKALVLAFSLSAWVVIGLWLEIYEKLDSGHPRVILRDAARQCAYGALGLVLFEYLFRLDLSRAFVAFFSAFAWTFLVPAVAVVIEALEGNLPSTLTTVGLVVVIAGVGMVTHPGADVTA